MLTTGPAVNPVPTSVPAGGTIEDAMPVLSVTELMQMMPARPPANDELVVTEVSTPAVADVYRTTPLVLEAKPLEVVAGTF